MYLSQSFFVLTIPLLGLEGRDAKHQQKQHQDGEGKKRKESIQLCKDRYHFGRNMKKSLKGLQLSPACFQTKNKKVKQQRQRWFSFDLGTRAEAEFSRALAVARRTKRTNAKIKQRVIKLLKDIPVTILECHTGRCGDSCKKHSKLCKGNNSYAKRCIFKGQVNLKESDEQKILKVLNARLGAEGVGQTFTGISTQCNEALNRSFTKTSPKNVTCSRAFPARVSRNALNFNLGFPLSTMLIFIEASLGGVPPPNVFEVRRFAIRKGV